MTQGMADRRLRNVVKLALTYTFQQSKWIFIGDRRVVRLRQCVGAGEYEHLDARRPYRFSHLGKGPYHGFSIRDRYIDRTLSNTFCGAAATNCPAGSTMGATFEGGLPLFKYNRRQLEYDF